MERVKLGGSGLMVSPVCYGSWQLSPRFWGDQPKEAMVRAIRRAPEVGINFYDTANAYGDGLAETVLGEALAPLRRDEIVVATKVYHHFYPDGRRHGDLSREHILAECDASLSRLRMDYVDLYQCHSFDYTTAMDETAEAMERLKKAGKIRAYGMSNFSTEQILLARRRGDFTTLQPRYNLLQSEAEETVLPLCAAEGIGTLVYSPLAMGLLTGKYKGDETFDDFRAKNANFQGERFRELCGRVAQLGPLAQKYDLTIVQLVVAATLANAMVDVAIVGIKRLEQVEDAAGAMGVTLSREDYWQIRRILGSM